ncbi:hypothetical protein ElyMa_001798800 [Elysia marginata]|uniref:Uncharacterized protein n=1 Tax=Elysia marginata TaxID=1093978 RepID=A0AAV4EFT7_9GAST|nr:hypothetical protein ElyMa_001798800 [Elysia marginata]
MNLKFKWWGQFAYTALHHKNPQRRPKGPCPCPTLKSCSKGKGRKQQAEDVTGSRSLQHACRRLRTLVTLLSTWRRRQRSAAS